MGSMTFLLLAIVLACANNVAYSRTFVQSSKLQGIPHDLDEKEGQCVAIDKAGTRVVIGGTKNGAYFYKRKAGKWVSDAVGGPLPNVKSCAMSDDGMAVIVGGNDNVYNRGQTWVYYDFGFGWNFPAAMQLVASPADIQGNSVAMARTGDGEYFVTSGIYKDWTGAVYVWLRQGIQLTQQGYLTPTNNIGQCMMGDGPGSLALSSDATTLAAGAWADNNSNGAVFIFVRSGTQWVQQTKLVGTGVAAGTQLGYSVALSGDGNVLVTGAVLNNAVLLYTRSFGSVWTQQSQILVPKDVVSEMYSPMFGIFLSMTPDAKSLVVGGSRDHGSRGAFWHYTNNGIAWSQEGKKYTLSDPMAPNTYFGNSLTLSRDGKTLIVAGFGADKSKGAAWMFQKST